MNVYDMLVYILRMGFVVIACALIITLIYITHPQLDATEIRATIHAGKAASHEPIQYKPGIFSEETFIQENMNILQGTDRVDPITTILTIRDVSGEQLAGPLYTNEPAYLLLSQQRRMRGVERMEWQMPTTFIQQNATVPAILHIEVLYVP